MSVVDTCELRAVVGPTGELWCGNATVKSLKLSLGRASQWGYDIKSVFFEILDIKRHKRLLKTCVQNELDESRESGAWGRA